MHRFALILVLCLAVPSAVFAAWGYTQTFDALSDGDLNGQDSWSGDTDYDIQSAVAVAGKAVAVTAASDGIIQRTITSASSGTFRIEMRKAGTTTGNNQSNIGQGDWGTLTNRLTSVGFGYNSNHDKIYYVKTDTSETQIQAFSADTWYTVDQEIDCSTDQYRVRIDEGSWTAWGALYNSNTCSNFSVVSFRKSDADDIDMYWDSISDGAAVAATGGYDASDWWSLFW